MLHGKKVKGHPKGSLLQDLKFNLFQGKVYSCE